MIILIFHIISALASMVVITKAAVSVSQTALRASYWLVGTTFASGTYLVIALHAPLLHACMSGIAYLAVAAVGIGITHYRLAFERS